MCITYGASHCGEQLLAVCPLSASCRIVLVGQIAGSAVTKTKHTNAASSCSGENWPGSTATPRGMANNSTLLP